MESNFKAKILFLSQDLSRHKINFRALSQYRVEILEYIIQSSTLKSYALICTDDSIDESSLKLLKKSHKLWINIGERVLTGSSGNIPTPVGTNTLLNLIRSIAGEANIPKIENIQKGSVIRSKVTPDFGKGIVISVINEYEVFVRFPLSKLCSDRPLRCHTSNLQLLGKLDIKSKAFLVHVE